jgi:pSer/pThr/pTyr-binding forkhead associated (FHA) protein
METDADLALGEFGIATRMVQPRGLPASPAEPAGQVAPGATMIYRPADGGVPAEPLAEPEEEPSMAVLHWDGQAQTIAKERVVLGRSRDCDVQLSDPNVSRRHAEVRQEGSSFWVVDLDSTNGIEVNGKRVKRAKLSDGDTFTLGTTDVTFSRERSG